MNRKIIVSLLNDSQLYQRAQAEGALAAAKAVGFDLEVSVANGNATSQGQQLLAAINAPPERRPAAIVVESVSAEGLEVVARTAAQAGIGWVILSSQPPYLRYLMSEFPKVPITAVVDDNLGIGQAQAKQFRALLPSGGTMVYVEGPGGSAPTIDRRLGMRQGLTNSGIQIVKTLNGDWTEASGEHAARNWLPIARDPAPDLIGCQNDNMAMGVRKAILAQRPAWSSVPLTGCDGLPDEGQRLVNEGLLAATVVKPTTAGRAVEIMARGLRGDPLPAPAALPARSVPPIEELAKKFASRQH